MFQARLKQNTLPPCQRLVNPYALSIFSKYQNSLSHGCAGLGSSAALVTSLCAAILHHLRVSDITTPQGSQLLHNVAQIAHCAAQGKIGSGFDVSCAVIAPVSVMTVLQGFDLSA
jgi:phosphomevalonate kinase